MKTYCYIRNGELTETSDSLIAKAKPAVFVEDGESGVQVLMEEAVEGMVYDQVIETTLTGRVEYRNGKIVAYTEPAQLPETAEQKHARIRTLIISSTDLDTIDLEGETFSDLEIGDIITERCFGGNPHAEKALTNKVLGVTVALLQGEPMDQAMGEKIASAMAKKAEVDAVRNLFDL